MGLRGAVLGVAGRMWSWPLGPSVEFPVGPWNAVLGCAGRMWSQPLGPSMGFPTGPRSAVL
eukprot:5784508-Pyramimonas_sp.AAC.1